MAQTGRRSRYRCCGKIFMHVPTQWYRYGGYALRETKASTFPSRMTRDDRYTACPSFRRRCYTGVGHGGLGNWLRTGHSICLIANGAIRATMTILGCFGNWTSLDSFLNDALKYPSGSKLHKWSWPVRCQLR